MDTRNAMTLQAQVVCKAKKLFAPNQPDDQAETAPRNTACDCRHHETLLVTADTI